MGDELDEDDHDDARLEALVEEYGPDMVLQVLELERNVHRAKLATLQWAASMDALASGLIELATPSSDWRAASGSVAEADLAAPPVTIGERVEPFGELLRYEVALNMRNTADLMQGFAALLVAQRSILGPAAIARGIFEASTWAAALLDPAVPQQERLRRLVMRRIVRLMAGPREDALLGEVDPGGTARASVMIEETDDEHGSHRDPLEEVEDLVALAAAMGWKVKRKDRSIELDGPLSIDWLVKHLGQRAGVEEFVWGNGSALLHGEHTPLMASMVAMIHEDLTGTVPAWMTRLNATGSWAGPRLLLATFAEYTGHVHLGPEFTDMQLRFGENTVNSGR